MKRVLRSSLSLVLAITIIFSSAYVGLGELDFSGLFAVEAEAVSESVSSISVGDTITLGKYLGEPIVWQCVDVDESGPLMLCAEILCYKEFDAAGESTEYHTDGWGYIRKERGSNCWYDANIRQWLNTTGAVEYTHCPPSYKSELGFLSNFESWELKLIKPVTQKTYVNSWETTRDGYVDGGSKETSDIWDYSALGVDYSSCYYQNTTDLFFFLNQEQIYNVFMNNPEYLHTGVEGVMWWTRIAGNTGASYENIFVPIGDANSMTITHPKNTDCGVRPAFYLNVDVDIEPQIMLSGMPTLSDQDAIDFLCFLYNRKDGFEGIDIRSDIQYKLLTGNLPSDMTVDEIKGLIVAFLSTVQSVTNQQISDSKYKTDLLFGILKKRLENELSGMSNLDEAIISEHMGNISKHIKNGFIDIGTDVVWRTVGIRITETHLNNIGCVFDGLSKATGIVSKVQTMTNLAFAAVDLYGMALGQENVGRLSYFNAYVNARGMSEIAFDAWMDGVFTVLADNSVVSNAVLDSISWINGKGSWTNHRDTIDRWGEYIYQLGEYQKQSFCRYNPVKYNNTCTTDGYTEYECVYCGNTFIGDVVEAQGHKYTKTIISPTCDEQGYDLYKCKNCVDSYKENYKDSLGHSVYKQEVIAPTCTDDGYTLNYCKCGYEWVADEVVAQQHNYVATVVEPTETKQGYTLNECLNCEDVYYSNYVNPTGHNYTASETEATCEQDGVITHTCECGESYSEKISSKGHNYVLDSFTLPSCTETGLKTYKCKNCDNTYTETVDVVPHDYSYKVELVEPSCSEQGYSTNYCVCGSTTVTNYIDAVGHSYEITETVDATCILDGYIKSECSVCGDVTNEVETSFGGHDFDLLESSELSCTSSQYDLYECSTCNTQKYENVVFTEGHTYETCETVAPTCTEEGTCTYFCTTCEETITETLPIIKHIKGEWEPANSGTENEMVRKCTSCGLVIETSMQMHSVTWNINGDIIVDYLPTGTVIAPPETKGPSDYEFSYWYPETPPLAMGEENLNFTAVFFSETECAYAADNYSFAYNLNENTATIYDYFGTEAEVMLPETLVGFCVVGTNANAFPETVTEITIPASITNINSHTFNSALNLQKIVVDEENTTYSDIDGVLYSKDKSVLVRLPIDYRNIFSFENNITAIGDNAFKKCKNFTLEAIPNSVTSIGKYAFEECATFSSITIPDNVTEIGSYAFRYCSNITEIDLPNASFSIGNYAFADTGITELTLPENLVSLGNSAFYNCENLKKINYNAINCTINVSNLFTAMLNHPFRNTSNLTEITVGESVESIPSYMFYGRGSITTLHMTNLEHWCSIDFQGAYANPMNFAEEVYLNGELITEQLVVPETIEVISNYAFHNFTGISSVIIPDSVTSIGANAFDDCSDLKYVFYTGTEEDWSAITIDENNSYLTDAYIHYETTEHIYSDEWTVDVAQTCIAVGSTSRNCIYCDSKIDVTEIPATGHSYSTEWTIDTEATCTTDGSKSHHCTVCDDKTDVTVIDALGHDYSTEWTIDTEATCITDGSKSHHCTVCGDKADVTVIDALGHDYSTEWTIDTEAACTTDGSKSHHCTVCDDKADVTVIDALGHDYSTEWTIDTEATCTTDGSKSHHCTVCDDMTDVTVIEAPGHMYEDVIVQPATCTSTGVKYQKCTGCSDELSDEVIEPTGHNYSTEWTVDLSPTCTTNGSKSHRCVNCDYKTDVTTIEALGHNYGDWEVFSEPTCNTIGINRKVCSNCSGAETERVPAKGHSYSTEWTIEVAPTCTEVGSKSHHCIVCDSKTDITVIEATGHNFVVQNVEDIHPHTTAYECSFCDETKTETPSVSDCVECNYTFIETDSGDYNLISYIGTEVEVIVPASYNGVAVTGIESNCFKGNTSITSVEIYDGITSIGNAAFYGCTNLTTVIIPGSLTSIGNAAFYNCTSLTSVTISDGVTSIGNSTFRGCTSLEAILIPDSVTTIGIQSFNGFVGTIFCVRDSTAHEYAVANNIEYVLINALGTENTEVDYENHIIKTTVQSCEDITEILGVSGTADVVITASYKHSNVELLGTGTIISIYEGGTLTGDYILVVYGDTNGDSVCDVLDCVDVERASNGDGDLSGVYALAADSNSDDMVDITDYQSIVNKALAS